MSSPGTYEQVTGALPVWVMIYYPLPIESIFFSLTVFCQLPLIPLGAPR